MEISPQIVIDSPTGLSTYLESTGTIAIDEPLLDVIADLGSELHSLKSDRSSGVPTLLQQLRDAVRTGNATSATSVLKELAKVFAKFSSTDFTDAVQKIGGNSRFASSAEARSVAHKAFVSGEARGDDPLTIADFVALVTTGQMMPVSLYTWRGGEFSGSFVKVAERVLPIPIRFHVFRSIELRDFSQFSTSHVKVDQDMLLNLVMACCLIAKDLAYLDYHYLNDPKYNGEKVQLPGGDIKVVQSTPPRDFFNVGEDEKLIVQRSNDGRDLVFTRQKGDDVHSQIFFVFRISQLGSIHITIDDLKRALQGTTIPSKLDL